MLKVGGNSSVSPHLSLSSSSSVFYTMQIMAWMDGELAGSALMV